MTAMKETSENAGRHVIAWDPSHSSLLHVVSGQDASSLSLYKFYADVGVAEGSDYEFATLLRLISDYEANRKSSNVSARLQSQQYRESIQECLRDFPTTDAADIRQRDLLSKILSVFRLAEIYVLPATSFMTDNNYHSSRDWLECPGIATADTIRFLRQYILPPLEGLEKQKYSERNMDEDMFDEDEQQRIMYFNNVEEKDLYWSLVLSLVRRGCLASAWDLLKKHSFYKTALDGTHLSIMTEEERALSREALQDWEQIGRVLLMAPLPGGRSTEHDEETASVSNQIEFEASSADTDLSYVHGMDVSCMDFVCWDIPLDFRDDTLNPGDYPILFTPELAMQKYKLWRDFAIHVRQTNRLCRQEPQIDHMFQLLCGDWTATKKPMSPFSSWSEQLCAELLYRTPDLRPRSIASRTLRLMRDFQEENESTSPIVSIMQGNAGRAMTELNELGGRSGAALPTTLMFLMFNLFVKAGVIPMESIRKELDFLINAAHSMVSSLHASRPDMGPQLAIRLLLPHATKARQVAAAISLILEHYSPSSEQYGRTTLSLCTPIISEPLTSAASSLHQDISVLVLEGCVSVLIQLYRSDASQNLNIESKTQLLLDGIGLETAVLPKPWLGSCSRLLTVECLSVVLSLLQAMSVVDTFDGTTDNDTMVSDAALMVKAKPMADTIERYISLSRKFVSCDSRQSYEDPIPFVAKLLIRVVTIFGMFRENSRPKERAKLIGDCLTDIADTQTSPIVQLWLLRVACNLIESQSIGVFDLSGVRTLLSRLSEFSSSVESPEVVGTTSEEIDIMRKCFSGALIKVCYVNSDSIRDSLRNARLHRVEDPVELYGKLVDLDVETAKRCIRSMLL